MRISPIDIQQKQFRTRPFGYDKAGVDQFLELLAEEYERLHRHSLDLQEELARAKAKIAEQMEREETLRETLVTTQRVTDELKATARREVDVMMAEAEIKAERLLHNAEEKRLQLIEEIQEIRRQKIDFEVSLRGLLERHVRMLEMHTPALERREDDTRLLEEPLPFAVRARGESGPAKSGEAARGDNSHADAYPQSGTPELELDFDQDDGNDEEDLLR